MKKLIILFLAVSFTAVTVYTQDVSNDEAMKLAQPGPEHELLKKFIGEWDIKFKYNIGEGMTMDGKGAGSCKVIMGGRFISVESNTEAMGMKVASFSILGYDRRINKYTAYGIDEMGTYAVNAEGDYNGESKQLVLKGSVLDPSGKTKEMQDFRFVYDLSKDGEIKMDLIFTKSDKSDWLVMEMWMTK